MAIITNYATLQTAIGDYLARSDLATFLPNFTQSWEEKFYRDPQNWGSWMEAALSVAIASGVAPVPADYLGLKIVYLSGNPPMKRISLDQLYSRYARGGSVGIPIYVSRNGGNFEFGPVATTGTLLGTYYAKPVVLRTSLTNWLTVNAPDLLLYGSLLQAESPFLKNDKRIGVWQGFYDDALTTYRAQFKEEDYSGSPPAAVVV